MPINKLIFFTVFCAQLLLASCFSMYSEPKYIKIKNCIVADYANQLKQEDGLYLVGGGGALMDNVKEISLMFACYQKMSIEEARILYVKIMEGYLQRINKNEAIRPYLDQYPFVWSNMDVQIMFRNEHNRYPAEGVAAVYFGKNGEVVYCGYAEDDLYHIHCETPEQAIQLARISNCP